jgi:carbon monoxide dehydrogenase subunit G
MLALTTSGCVAAALPAVGLAAMSDAAGSGAKAGVEYSFGGTAYRTFSAPLSQVRSAVLQSFRDLEIGITQDAPIVGGGAQITGEALHRKITVQLEPVTPALTRLKMSVRHGLVGKDRATSAELIDQTARALAEIRPIAGASRRAP